MDKEQSKRFRGANDYTFCIFYIIEEIQGIENINNKVSNTCIESISQFEKEKEVLVFPFSCFEIVNIKEIKVDKIDYEIHLKYLGNYSNYIKEQFGTNFFDNIQISNFSQELIDSGILQIHNFFSTWEQKEKPLLIQLDKICFLFDTEANVISFSKNEIIVFNIYAYNILQKINIHTAKILDIIKSTNNRICSCSEDRTIKIIKLIENNTKYSLIHNIDLNGKYATQINFLENEDICYVDNNDNIGFIELKENQYSFNKFIEEEDKIIIMKKLLKNKMVYITENIEGNKKIKFINLIQRIKDNNVIDIKDEYKLLKVIDLLLFYDYIIIGYNHRIDFINYQKPHFIIQSLSYFNFEISNMIILSSNRIILGYYDYDKKESIIREHLLRVEDLQNNKDNLDCIGLGTLENEKIENILKINESQVLINIKNKYCAVYERNNQVSDKLKQKLMDIGIENKEIQRNKTKSINFIEEEKNSDDNMIQYKKSFKYKEINNIFGKDLNLSDISIDNNQEYNNNINKYNSSIYTSINKYSPNLNLQGNIYISNTNISMINKNNIKTSNEIELKKINTNKKKEDDILESKKLISFFPKANDEELIEEDNESDNLFKNSEIII